MELEELERRKKELELRRDIARLERNEKIVQAIADFDRHLLWVVPCTLGGLFFMIVGIHDGWFVGVLMGVFLLAPPMPRLLRFAKKLFNNDAL